MRTANTMREYLASYFIPGPALALLGVLLAIEGSMNFDRFADTSVELGLSRLVVPALVGFVAVLFGAAGFACTIYRRS